jgi:hypothetical protein
MDHVWILATAALIFLPPVVLFRPLVLAIADRISGKKAGGAEVALLRKRVEALEQQLSSLQPRVLHVEEASEFSKKLLEDLKKPAEK